jgi:hypothetical protein
MQRSTHIKTVRVRNRGFESDNSQSISSGGCTYAGTPGLYMQHSAIALVVKVRMEVVTPLTWN